MQNESDGILFFCVEENLERKRKQGDTSVACAGVGAAKCKPVSGHCTALLPATTLTRQPQVMIVTMGFF